MAILKSGSALELLVCRLLGPCIEILLRKRSQQTAHTLFSCDENGAFVKYKGIITYFKTHLLFFRSKPISSRHVKVLATLQILTITKKNLSASQTPKNALKNLPISNKICSKTKYKKRSSRPLSLTKKKESTSSKK